VRRLAHVKQKLEILVDADEPVAEINNVISAFLRIHRGRDAEILAAVRAEIDKAVAALESAKQLEVGA